jgi:hypothetical protein
VRKHILNLAKDELQQIALLEMFIRRGCAYHVVELAQFRLDAGGGKLYQTGIEPLHSGHDQSPNREVETPRLLLNMIKEIEKRLTSADGVINKE